MSLRIHMYLPRNILILSILVVLICAPFPGLFLTLIPFVHYVRWPLNQVYTCFNIALLLNYSGLVVVGDLEFQTSSGSIHTICDTVNEACVVTEK
jgi:hypothetical protein